MALETLTSPIRNSSERIDSRDVMARIEEMQELIADGAVPDDADAAELAALQDLALRGADLEDWVHGAVLVRENFFVDYARELFDDTSEPEVREMTRRWPFDCIDWERAARELSQDYTDVSFAGVTYLAR